MKLFHRHTIAFTKPDPLGDGLGDDIAAEQREADAIRSLDDAPAEQLEAFWGEVISDAKKDKDFFAFSDE